MLFATTLILATAAALSVHASRKTLIVTDGDNDGQLTFRQAVALASAGNTATAQEYAKIVLKTDVHLTAALVYTGLTGLEIVGDCGDDDDDDGRRKRAVEDEKSLLDDDDSIGYQDDDDDDDDKRCTISQAVSTVPAFSFVPAATSVLDTWVFQNLKVIGGQDGIRIALDADIPKNIVIDNVEAHATGRTGIFIDQGSTTGALDFTIRNSELTGTGRNGLVIDSEATTGDVSLRIENSEFVDNADDGALMDFRTLTTGSFSMQVSDSQFSNNGAAGLPLHLAAHTSSAAGARSVLIRGSSFDNNAGDATQEVDDTHDDDLCAGFYLFNSAGLNDVPFVITVEDSTFDNNAAIGFLAQCGGAMQVSFDTVRADSNTGSSAIGNGIRVDTREQAPAAAVDASIVADFKNVQANENGVGGGLNPVGTGITFSSDDTLAATLDDVQTNGNAGHGVFTGADDDGPIAVVLSDFESSNNGGDGVFFDADPGVTEYALTIDDVETNNNGQSGITFSGSRDDGTYTITFNGKHESESNGEFGLNVAGRNDAGTMTIVNFDEVKYKGNIQADFFSEGAQVELTF